MEENTQAAPAKKIALKYYYHYFLQKPPWLIILLEYKRRIKQFIISMDQCPYLIMIKAILTALDL